MSEITLVWVQVIIGILFFIFLGRLLVKLTKNSLLSASLLAAFLLIWTDAGGLSQAEKIGAWEYIRGLLQDILTFGVFFLIAYFTTMSGRNEE